MPIIHTMDPGYGGSPTGPAKLGAANPEQPSPASRGSRTVRPAAGKDRGSAGRLHALPLWACWSRAHDDWLLVSVWRALLCLSWTADDCLHRPEDVRNTVFALRSVIYVRYVLASPPDSQTPDRGGMQDSWKFVSLFLLLSSSCSRLSAVAWPEGLREACSAEGNCQSMQRAINHGQNEAPPYGKKVVVCLNKHRNGRGRTRTYKQKYRALDKQC